MKKRRLIEIFRILWKNIREWFVSLQKTEEFHAFDTRKGTFRVSKESFDFILSWESCQCHPYVPVGNTGSGVTIGYGYDLGHQNAAIARKELAGLCAADEIERLVAVTGKTRDAARDALHGVADIGISRENALRLALITARRYAEETAAIYPQVMKLHPHCQGALLSLVINRGASLTLPGTDRRFEMKQIQEDLLDGKPENIPGRLESMKRLWRNSGQDGLLKRRDGEAELFRKGLSRGRQEVSLFPCHQRAE
jgi:GH24 family phage-related lysozyme (muramidase)